MLMQMSSSSLTPIKNLLGPFFIGVVVSSMCETALDVLLGIDEMETDYMVSESLARAASLLVHFSALRE